jgi:Fe-S-cluster containining protein
MEPGAFFLIILLSLCVYLLFIREYFLTRHGFKCKRCGGCCKYLVTLTKGETDAIKKLGYRDFMSRGGIFGFNKYIRHANGYCMFLGFKDGITYCKLEDVKPRICRDFPCKKGLFGKKYDARCRNFYYKLY